MLIKYLKSQLLTESTLDSQLKTCRPDLLTWQLPKQRLTGFLLVEPVWRPTSGIFDGIPNVVQWTSCFVRFPYLGCVHYIHVTRPLVCIRYVDGCRV